MSKLEWHDFDPKFCFKNLKKCQKALSITLPLKYSCCLLCSLTGHLDNKSNFGMHLYLLRQARNHVLLLVTSASPWFLNQDDISTSIRLLEAERILGLYIYLPRLVDIINNENFPISNLENLLFLISGPWDETIDSRTVVASPMVRDDEKVKIVPWTPDFDASWIIDDTKSAR